MICPHCNKESLGLAFCDFCGKELPKVNASTSNNKNNKSNKKSATNKKADIPNNGKKYNASPRSKTSDNVINNSNSKRSSYTNYSNSNSNSSYKYIGKNENNNFSNKTYTNTRDNYNSNYSNSNYNNYGNNNYYDQYSTYPPNDSNGQYLDEPKKHNFFWWFGAILIWPISVSILFAKSKDIKLDMPLRAFILVLIWLFNVGTIVGLTVFGIVKYNQIKDFLELGEDFDMTDYYDDTLPEDFYEDSSYSSSSSYDNFELIAGELGDFGEEVTMNAGTDYEYTTIIYRIPAGTYNATNMTGQEAQINLYYDNIITNDDGLEEWEDGYSIFIEDGAVEEITIEPGYIISLDIPADILFTRVDDIASENNMDSTDKESLRNDLSNQYNVEFCGSVQNDSTGINKYAIYNSNTDQSEIAYSYYKAYFSSEDEIHALINKQLNTIARIEKIDEDNLDVSIYTYSNGEEKDYSSIYSGDLLYNYNINLNTGIPDLLYDNGSLAGEDMDQSFYDNDVTYDDDQLDNSSSNSVSSSKNEPGGNSNSRTNNSSDSNTNDRYSSTNNNDSNNKNNSSETNNNGKINSNFKTNLDDYKNFISSQYIPFMQNYNSFRENINDDTSEQEIIDWDNEYDEINNKDLDYYTKISDYYFETNEQADLDYYEKIMVEIDQMKSDANI